MAYQKMTTHETPQCPRHHIPMESSGIRYDPNKGVQCKTFECRKTWQSGNSFHEAQCRQWADGPDTPYTPALPQKSSGMETHTHDPGACDSPFTCACRCPFCVNAAHQIMLTSTPARYDFYSPKGQAILNRPMTEEEFEQEGGYFTGDDD